MKVSPLCLGAMMFGAWGNPLDPGLARESTDVEETLSALTDLVRAGKVRYLGSSTFPPSQVVEAQWVARERGLQRFVCEQPPYSMLIRAVEADLLPTAQRHGMGVIPWSPLAAGWLSGRFRNDAPAEELASRRADRLPGRYDLSIPANQRKLEFAARRR
jgi:aryl-alcohol dehydrogenase-like predicted oxidoreductase